jgi:ABC-type branched-subunit amino acid transport system substrate-binding protein
MIYTGLRRSGPAIAASIALASALGACSSSASPGSSSAAGPIKIELIGSIASSAFSLPDVSAGAQAAVKEVNVAGGVNGRQLSLTICNDQSNPNVAASCARGAVQNQVAAVVGETSLVGSSIIPILQQAGIPSIADVDISPIEHQSPIAFPILTTGVAYAGLGPAMESAGCTRPAAISSHDPGVDQGITWAFNYGALKDEHISKQSVSPGSVDVTSPVEAVLSQGANCVLLSGDETSDPAMITMVRKLQTSSVTLAVTPGAITPQALAATADGGNGVICASMYYLSTTGATPQYAQFVRALKTQAPKIAPDQLAENSYNSVLLFKRAATGLKVVDAKTVLNAMNHLSNADTGLTVSPVNFSKLSGVPGYERLFAFGSQTYVFKSGAWTPEGTVQDVDASLQ